MGGHVPELAERWELVSNICLGVETRSIAPEERSAYGDALPEAMRLRLQELLRPGRPSLPAAGK